MVTFRYHIVSIVAFFLALGIGVIVGSTVIDRVLVDTLEDQQRRIEDDISEVRRENDDLNRQISELGATSEQLATEGSQRLLDGALADVGVLVLAVRGAESAGLGDLVALLATADASYRGTVWFTERFALDSDEASRDLARALTTSASVPRSALRSMAIDRVATTLRVATAPEAGPPGLEALVGLRDAGFLDYEPPEGAPEDLGGLAGPGTRIALVSSSTAVVDDGVLAEPLARALVRAADGAPPARLLAAEASEPPNGAPPGLVTALRDDDELARSLSTVDDVDDFAGRLAAVLAILDLGDGRVGHYGTGPGAQRLIPAPVR
ncbi:MAG: copper transporter [Acidimicrobiales bacterium]